MMYQDEINTREKSGSRSRARIIKKSENKQFNNDDPYYCGYRCINLQPVKILTVQLYKVRGFQHSRTKSQLVRGLPAVK